MNTQRSLLFTPALFALIGATALAGCAETDIEAETETEAAAPIGPAGSSHRSADDAAEPELAASPPPAPDRAALLARTARADDVVYGEVVALDYGMTATDLPVPVTYVTYARLDEAAGTVTLMVAGGLLPDGNVAMPVGVPSFDVGDTDVLLVSGNGQTGCPLVDCAAGRLRVVDGRVFTDDGRAWVDDGHGQPRIGTARDLAEVRTRTIQGAVIERDSGRTLDARTDDALPVDAVLATLRASRG
jgi:hypothetical protein